MKVATWNINSIRARSERLLAWLAREQPDILCLQETKVTDDIFPHDLLREAGYTSAVYGQKTYNGVAVLSSREMVDVRYGFSGGWDGESARLIDVGFEDLHVLSVYIPNGDTVGSEKHAYKLDWIERLGLYLDHNFDPGTPLLVCGDFNVAPEEIDVARPEVWRNSVLFDVQSRQALARLVSWGLHDTLRLRHPEGGIYSWWDYRALSFPKNDGLRIDQIWATSPLALRCTDAYVDREERKGAKPSDHAPVIAVFE